MVEKITIKTQWDEKYLREALWMPFGSMCNLVGQSYQGKEIDTAKLEELATKIFGLALQFTKETYERTEKQSEEEPEVPVKTKK